MYKDHIESNAKHITEHLEQDIARQDLVEFEDHYEYLLDKSMLNTYGIGSLEYRKCIKVC